jgi:hypothetical protein
MLDVHIDERPLTLLTPCHCCTTISEVGLIKVIIVHTCQRYQGFVTRQLFIGCGLFDLESIELKIEFGQREVVILVGRLLCVYFFEPITI